MSSWNFVSEDNIRGRNQKGGALWARVHQLYHEHQAEKPDELSERNIQSLKGRWKRLNENANKWVAAYQEACSRRRSGMNKNDVEKEAQTIYEAGGSKFMDLTVFNEVMCKHPKWALTSYHDRTHFRPENEKCDDEESRGSSKRSKTSEDVEHSMPSSAETPSTGNSNISRPIGRDKAKKKGKGKISQSDFANEFTVELRALRLSRDNEAELMKNVSNAKIELEREKIHAGNIKMHQRTLNTLLAKSHLSADEEELKRRPMEIVFGS
ncbi:DNA binding [Striga hermonthica]|uniref:DNA binding n=1 Tax=Striga hermonthica TaxID=68872 RepID=A0A9N7MIT0_STRHE|nr:DNA binding [Striga hermonthica]